MHGIRYLSSTARFILVALAATAMMSCMMLLALIPEAQAAPGVLSAPDALSDHAHAGFGYVLVGLVAAALATAAVRCFSLRTLYGVCAAVLTFIALAPGAMAADGSAVVDAGPFVLAMSQIIAPTIVSVGGVLAMWVLGKLATFIGMKVDASFRSTVDQGLEHAVGFAMSKLQDRAIGGIPIDMKSQAIAVAAGYAQNAIPGALKHFGKTPKDLADMIESRLEWQLIDPKAETAKAENRALRARPISQ